jgi:outer membrane lipoprotein SlyB
MPSNPLPATPQSGSLYDDAVGGTLRSLVDRYGVTLLGESGRLRGLLQDECPQAKREISVLLQALEERVPQDLLRVHSGEPIASLSPRLVKRLSDEKAMSPQASRWAVATWAQGLGLDVALGMHAEAAITDDTTQRAAPNVLMAANEEFSDQVNVPPPPRKVPPWAIAAAVLALAVACWYAFFQPKLEISGVDMQGPFVGDGKPRQVAVHFSARNNTVRSVEVRFAHGDGNWNAQPATYDASANATASAQTNAGTLAYTTSKPISATFSYVLIGGDGKRSAPFERTFEIVPPLVITDVSVPRPLLVGQNFAVTIKYQRSGADIVKVERHVVSSNVPWSQVDAVQPLTVADANGSVQYGFDAAPRPMRSTVEFVLVDAQGVRSDPKRVALNIGTTEPSGTGPGTVLSVQELKTPGQATGMGAVIGGVIGGILGNTLGHGRGRVATTVAGTAGGAYAGNQVEGGVRSTSVWRTTVRLDDGVVRTLTSPTTPRWRIGDRVNVTNGAVSLM